ncbi:hypothetical protein ACFLZP_00605 [Patescibacteria group bacterium]
MTPSERKVNPMEALGRQLFPEQIDYQVEDQLEPFQKMATNHSYYRYYWQSLGQSGAEGRSFPRRESCLSGTIVDQCLSFYRDLFTSWQTPNDESEKKATWEKNLSHLLAFTSTQYAYLFFGASSQTLGRGQSALNQLKDVFLPVALLTYQATQSHPKKDQDQVFFFFLDLVLFHQATKHVRPFFRHLTIAQHLEKDLFSQTTWLAIDNLPLSERLVGVSAHNQQSWQNSQQRREQVFKHPQRVAFLKSLALRRATKDQPGLSYWDLFAQYWGFTSQRQQKTVEKIKNDHPFLPNRLRVQGKLSFAAAILANNHPQISLPPSLPATWGPEVFAKSHGVPADVQIGLRRLATKSKIEALRNLTCSDQWRSVYRSLAVCHFDLLLLELFEKALTKKEIVHQTRLGNGYKRGIYKDLAPELAFFVHKYYPEASTTTIKPHLAIRRLGLMLDLTTNTNLNSDPAEDADQKEAEIGLYLEDALVAADLINALDSGNYRSVALRELGTTWLFERLRRTGSKTTLLETHSVTVRQFTFLGKLAIVNLVLAGEREKLLALESRFAFRDSSFFQTLAAFDYQFPPKKEQVAQAIEVVSQLKLGRLSTQCQQIALDYNCPKKPAHLERFILPQIQQGTRPTEICQFLSLSSYPAYAAKIFFQEIQQILVRHPLEWVSFSKKSF